MIWRGLILERGNRGSFFSVQSTIFFQKEADNHLINREFNNENVPVLIWASFFLEVPNSSWAVALEAPQGIVGKVIAVLTTILTVFLAVRFGLPPKADLLATLAAALVAVTLILVIASFGSGLTLLAALFLLVIPVSRWVFVAVRQRLMRSPT